MKVKLAIVLLCLAIVFVSLTQTTTQAVTQAAAQAATEAATQAVTQTVTQAATQTAEYGPFVFEKYYYYIFWIPCDCVGRKGL